MQAETSPLSANKVFSEVVCAKESSDKTPWIIIFSDLFFLLLTLFVLRISMSITPLKPSADVRGSSPPAEDPALRTFLEDLFGPPVPSAESSPVIRLGTTAVPQENSSVLRVSLNQEVFVQDSTVLSFRGAQTVAALSALLRSRKNSTASVTAYADEGNATDGTLGSGWELAGARALTVVRQMLDAGVEPQALRVSGMPCSRAAIQVAGPAAALIRPGLDIEFSAPTR